MIPELQAAFQNSVMLHPGGYNMLFAFFGRFFQSAAKNSNIICLCTAGGKIDLIRLGIDKIRYLLSGFVKKAPGIHTEMMQAGRLPK